MALYNSDPLIWHQNIAIGFASSLISTAEKLIEDSNKFSSPLLLMQGDADRIVSPEGSLNFFKNCSSKDKSYLSLKGWFHDIINEPEKDQILTIITKWMEDRVNSSEVINTNSLQFGTIIEGHLKF